MCKLTLLFVFCLVSLIFYPLDADSQMMTELFYTVWLFFVETKYHVFWGFFFFKNIQVSHILLCSWFWSTLLWFFFFTVLHLSTFTFSLWSFIAAYFLLLFSTMLLLVCLNVDVYVSVCVCVCNALKMHSMS